MCIPDFHDLLKREDIEAVDVCLHNKYVHADDGCRASKSWQTRLLRKADGWCPMWMPPLTSPLARWIAKTGDPNFSAVISEGNQSRQILFD